MSAAGPSGLGPPESRRRVPPVWAFAGAVAFGGCHGCNHEQHVAWGDRVPTADVAPLPVVVSEAGVRHAVLDVTVDCRARAKPISPDIYGFGYDLTDTTSANDGRQWLAHPGARRFGGNASSRYDWETGNYNHGSDWVFANDRTPGDEPLYLQFLRENEARGAASAITIPTLGWIAKDATSASFPLAKLPDQRSVDTKRGAGDGFTPGGRPITPPPPTETSLPGTPELEGRWVAAIAARASKKARIYILDNEPGLWSTTHRDVHPEPMTYDELLSRTVAYAHEVRVHDPPARIAGPSAYGWPDYFFSGRDSAISVRLRPDRRLHEDLPILAYYLRELHRHEQRTGERLLDLLDVHFYPQSDDIGIGIKGGTDPSTAATRVRSPRALWDPSYVDESWIKEPVRLLPRLHEWIDRYYPGVGIEIGEWNYGAEGDMSGGLATAETLGRFADGGVAAAFYWTYPAPESPAFFAFRAFRDFDGHGGRFLDALVPVRGVGEGASVWASRDEGGKHLVLVVLDFMPGTALDAHVHLDSCGSPVRATAYTFVSGARDFATTELAHDAAAIRGALPPYSMTSIDVRLE